MRLARTGFALVLVAAAATCSASADAAQVPAYPTKPIRLVLAQPPGGATDIQMRLYAQKVSGILGQQMIVDNRAAGGIGAVATFSMVAKAASDGYTLLAVIPAFTFAPALIKDMSVDPVRDFAPVAQLIRAPYLLVVNTGLAVKTVKDLIALAKAKPKLLNFGAGNVGSGTHLTTMWFLTEAGIRTESTYVPYKGTGQALLDLAGGRIHGAMTSIISALPYVKTGRVRALGISTAQRSNILPEIPTIAEQGVPGYDAYTFTGWAAPAKTPAAIIDKLNGAAATAASSADLSEKLKADGGEPVVGTPREFGQLIAREIPRWRRLVTELGITTVPE